MIRPDKQRNALTAISTVLVFARQLAYEGKSAEVADVLDVGEYLPILMLEPQDRTFEFREQLTGLARKREEFSRALEQFDALGSLGT